MAFALLLGRLLLAAVFLVAGVAKLRDLSGSRRAVGEFGVPARATALIGTLLPLAELAVAGALIAGPTAPAGALAALVLLILFCVAIAWNLSRGRAPDCHCFGQLHSSPASRRTVVRNLGLAALAFSVAAGLGSLAPAAALAGVGLAALLVGTSPSWLRRRGRGLESAGEDAASPEGLPLGTHAPSFRLSGLAGGSHTLDSLRAGGRPLLLLFGDPNCGPCIEMASEVARWQREHSDELTIAVIERDRDGSRSTASDEHGRRNVLLQSESEVSDLYGAHGTPTGVLVGRDGAIASGIAAGSREIEALMARTVEAFRPRLSSEVPMPRVFDLPLRRRELLVRGAGVWAATSAVLAWPLRAAAGVGSRRQRLQAERCEDRSDCPDSRNMTCTNGRCRCRESTFDGRRLTRCDPQEATTSRCFDLGYDSDHCGRCNQPCRDNDQCCDGKCAPFRRNRCSCGRDGFCDDDGVCSGDPPQCVQCSSAGMRRCGNLCGNPETQICCGDKIYYKFQLPPGDWTCCGPRGRRRLVDTRENEKHCGGCNKPCGKGKFCYQRRCRKSCPPGLKRCGQSCGDPKTELCCGGKRHEKKGLADGTTCCGGQLCPPRGVAAEGDKWYCRNGKCVCERGGWFCP